MLAELSNYIFCHVPNSLSLFSIWRYKKSFTFLTVATSSVSFRLSSSKFHNISAFWHTHTMDMHLLNSPHKPCIVTSVKCRNNAKKMDRVQMLERLNHYHGCSNLSNIAFIFITKFNLPNDVKSRDWRRKSESTISATLRPENIPPTPRKPIVILSLGEINNTKMLKYYYQSK